ncbi:MAG: DUF2281 domain-containing protein [Oscillospiraceae bacterium]|nr:DUF2281 domain-containing protein [Oscillospiraceae bacterium]
MSVKEQLISDIKLLPNHTLQAISIIVKEIVKFNIEEEKEKIRRKRIESFGSMENKIWMADDFDQPLEDMMEYMQ